jgi:hypothetical protein
MIDVQIWKTTNAHVGTDALVRPVERISTANHEPIVILSEDCSLRRRRREQPQSKDPVFASSFHRPVRAFSALVLIALLTSFAAAQTLTGTVKDATTNKPAAGDEVILLSLGQGMEEAGRTKTDAKGNFSFKLDNAQAPHLVRAIHQDVTYHRMAPPGTTSVEVPVYDVGKKIDGIAVVADIMRVQAEQGQLEVMRAFAVQNNSNPPRTQMNERNLEFYLPEGSQIIESQAMTANGQPVNSAPVPVDDKKTRYAFLFPLRPGVTQFQVAYQLPYTGTANIDPKSIYPLQHFVAILPKSIQFAPAPGTGFQPMNDPQQPDANVQVASGAKAGDNLAFKISGEGTLQARQENGGAPNAGDSAQGSSANDARPGGGLGPPIDAPDPLQKYRWYILGGFAAALVIGGVYVASRQQAANRNALSSKNKTAALTVESDFDEIEIHAREPNPSSLRAEHLTTEPLRSAAHSSTALLDALKEELFQLEIEHKQGHISQAEYEKSKAALDLTLERALKREAAK